MIAVETDVMKRAGHRCPREVKCIAVECSDHFDHVARRELFRFQRAGERGDVDAGGLQNIDDFIDAVGIDLYEPLSASPAATDQELLDGARAAAAKIEGVARRWERPAIVTELGLPSRPAAWQAPQEEVAGAAADGAAQERGYRALFEALWGRPWLAGLYWWKYETSPRRGREENSLTPRGKPAENVIRQYYLGAAGKLSGGE